MAQADYKPPQTEDPKACKAGYHKNPDGSAPYCLETRPPGVANDFGRSRLCDDIYEMRKNSWQLMRRHYKAAEFWQNTSYVLTAVGGLFGGLCAAARLPAGIIGGGVGALTSYIITETRWEKHQQTGAGFTYLERRGKLLKDKIFSGTEFPEARQEYVKLLVEKRHLDATAPPLFHYSWLSTHKAVREEFHAKSKEKGTDGLE